MKTASLPPLRVAPELRADAESVLKEGETLSGFLEESLRQQIQRRKLQQAFVARGLAGGEEARRSGHYFSADQVLSELRSRFNTGRTSMRK